MTLTRRAWPAVIALLLSAGAGAAFGCGHCVEDKIAAVYDHGMVSRAAAAGHGVAYCLIEGGPAADEALKREIVRSLESTPGVDPGTARVSLESASLAFAFDAAGASFDAILQSAKLRLAVHGLGLVPIRVMERPAEFK